MWMVKSLVAGAIALGVVATVGCSEGLKKRGIESEEPRSKEAGVDKSGDTDDVTVDGSDAKNDEAAGGTSGTRRPDAPDDPSATPSEVPEPGVTPAKASVPGHLHVPMKLDLPAKISVRVGESIVIPISLATSPDSKPSSLTFDISVDTQAMRYVSATVIGLGDVNKQLVVERTSDTSLQVALFGTGNEPIPEGVRIELTFQAIAARPQVNVQISNIEGASATTDRIPITASSSRIEIE